ncbi:MAG TPA: hypothetical protein VJ869_06270 [Sphaerochaeta sp.]|nr:hypothetical protein [Sphaerochaeta sp.]
MKRASVLLILSLFVFNLTSLAAAPDFTQADLLMDLEEFSLCETELMIQKGLATTDLEQSEVLWRLARLQVNIGDELPDDDKDGKYREYEKGEAYALASIEKHPNAMAYLWKSSNNGRWGQTKGPLNALGKAKGMLEDLTMVVNDFNTLDSTETWYVLSSIYDELPGGIISFGNKTWAVSYMRKAMETLPANLLLPGHYKKFAEELYSRNWNASKRAKEFQKMESDWKKAPTNLEKYRFYEGKDGGKVQPFYSSVQLTQMSDRQEALMVLSYIKAKYKVFKNLQPSDAKDMAEIEDIYSKWI